MTVYEFAVTICTMLICLPFVIYAVIRRKKKMTPPNALVGKIAVIDDGRHILEYAYNTSTMALVIRDVQNNGTYSQYQLLLRSINYEGYIPQDSLLTILFSDGSSEVLDIDGEPVWVNVIRTTKPGLNSKQYNPSNPNTYVDHWITELYYNLTPELAGKLQSEPMSVATVELWGGKTREYIFSPSRAEKVRKAFAHSQKKFSKRIKNYSGTKAEPASESSRPDSAL